MLSVELGVVVVVVELEELVVVESDSDGVVVVFLWCLCFFVVLEDVVSGLVLVSLEAELLPVLPLIDPALGLCCESGFCPLGGFCLSMESGELVCGLCADGVEDAELPDIEPLCWSELLLDCAKASPAPSSTTEAV